MYDKYYLHESIHKFILIRYFDNIKDEGRKRKRWSSNEGRNVEKIFEDFYSP